MAPPLWKNQIYVIDKALKHTGYMIAHEMGTGKSRSAIEIINRATTASVLILAPKTVVSVWPEQLNKYLTAQSTILALDTGSVRKKAEALNKLLKTKHAKKNIIAIINYESAWRPPLGPSYNNLNRMIDKGLLISTEWDLVILDESHRIKAPGSKISWFCSRLRKSAKKRLCLTGTPTPNSPLDIYAQYRFLDPSVFGTSFVRFRNHYAVMGGYENRQVIGYKNEEEFNKKFYSIAHVVKLRDVVDMPDEMHEVRHCNLSPAAQKIYNTVEKDFYIKVANGELTVNNALVKLLRLAQICGGFLPFDDGDSSNGEVIDKAKIEVLQDILTDLGPDEPAVVFSRFTSEIRRIKDFCSKINRTVSVISEGVNQLAEWKAGYSSVLVVQIKSGSEGIDLTRARYCIFFSVDYSLGVYNQALARTMRPGQTRSVIYYHIVAKNTVDVHIYKALRQKRKIIDYIFNSVRKN